MSKFTLGQRKFPTLGLRSQQPKNYVGPTLSCYLGFDKVAFFHIENTPLTHPLPIFFRKHETN